jgi:hypothetical protein
MRDFGDKVVFSNHLPADDDINAAVDDFSIDGEQGFGFTSKLI